MQTLIELYDKEPLENVLATCIFEPEILVFICDERDNSMRKERAVGRLLQNRKLKTKARFYYTDATDLKKIERILAAIVRDYPHCVFDVSGGKDLVLLMTGIFCKREDVPMFSIDVPSGRFVNVNRCEQLAAGFALPQLTADDLFAAAGAKAVGSGHFATAMIDGALIADVKAVWREILADISGWNETAGYFQAACSGVEDEVIEVERPCVMKINQQVTARCNLRFLERLAACGVVEIVTQSEARVRVRFKSELHKKCLQNQGIWLEMFGYITAKETGVFGDVRTSVVVDWDGGEVAKGTRNEIDILLVRGVIPAFISCKMGVPTPLALSEIKLLSEKFGGVFTQTVLLTASDAKRTNPALVQRAKDLNIWLIDRGDLQNNALASRLKEIGGAKESTHQRAENVGASSF